MGKNKNADSRTESVGKIVNTDGLTVKQRKEFLGLVKRMLPPVPSKPIIDVRISLWFIKRFYFVLIIGKDTRKEYRAKDSNLFNKGLNTIMKLIIYSVMLLSSFFVVFYLLYLIKSYAGIDIFKNRHLLDIVRSLLRF